MKLSFRWYGTEDPVTLDHIKQIPNMQGIVSAIYDIPVGEVWPVAKIQELKNKIESMGLKLAVIESVPVHEDIKMGLPSREQYIKNYQTTIRNLAACNIDIICYNFMPVFDWTRSELAYVNEDGSTSLIFDEEQIAKIDPKKLALPGWDTSYDQEHMKNLINFYNQMTHEQLWDNLTYFLKAIIPVAEEVGVKMAIHPDDPPVDIFGIPRIITNFTNLKRLIDLIDSPANGITLCTGSLGSSNENDLIKMIEYFGKERQRIYFAHMRNVKNYQKISFKETAHLSKYGDVDFYQVIKTYLNYDFAYYYRPDHGRMIWDETGKPGYGLFDRALGASYLEGIIEAVTKQKEKS